jgi:hypothetical protein
VVEPDGRDAPLGEGYEVAPRSRGEVHHTPNEAELQEAGNVRPGLGEVTVRINQQIVRPEGVLEPVAQPSSAGL